MARSLTCLVLGSALLASCSSSKSSRGDESSGTEASTGSVQATSLKDISLSSILSIKLPDSVKGSGTTSLRLNEAKSMEACQLRNQIQEGLSNISQISSTFCFLENDSGIEFGKKYNIDFGMGGGGGAGDPGSMTPPSPGLADSFSMPSIQLWIDDSEKAAGKITVWMCEDKQLSQMIQVEGAASGKAKGRAIMKNSMDMGQMAMTFHRAMSFDNKYSDSDVTNVIVKEKIDMTSEQFGSESARRLLALELSEAAVSKVASSFAGNQGGAAIAFSTAGYFDKDYGSVIAKGSMGGNEYSNESFFDGASNVLEADVFPAAFGADGSVKISAEMVPGFLPETFTPESFPEGAWDCSGTEDYTMDMSADPTAASACKQSWDELSQQSCTDSSFAQGQAVEVDASKQVDASEFEGFDDSAGE